MSRLAITLALSAVGEHRHPWKFVHLPATRWVLAHRTMRCPGASAQLARNERATRSCAPGGALQTRQAPTNKKILADAHRFASGGDPTHTTTFQEEIV